VYVATERQRQIARQFMETIPALLHSIGSEIRSTSGTSGPVTMAQFRSMAALRRGPHTLNELAALHEVSAPTMSRLISTLVERGWVSREPDPQDRRQVILTLTAEGESTWQELLSRGTEHLADLLANLSEDEIASLDAALAALARVAQARRKNAESSQRTMCGIPNTE
jgi:DNA-binding MarR family transcriptional regulator